MATFTTTQSSDDANEVVSSGAVSITTDGTTSAAKLDGTNHGGFRFPNVTVAQGATISSATIQFEQLAGLSGLGSQIGNQTIYGEAADNSAVFATTSNNISGRSRTTATGTKMLDTATGGASQTADVTSVIQEIVNRAGWASGNALSILFIGTGTAASNWIQPYMWDYFSGFYHAKLTVTTGTPPVTSSGFLSLLL